MLGMLLAAAAGFAFNRAFVAWAVAGADDPGVSAGGTFTVNSDGTVEGVAIGADMSSPGSAGWWLQTVTGIGANFYVRFVPTVGSFTTNGASSWQSLGTGRSCSKSATTGSGSVTFTIQIATDAAGANIVFESTGNTISYSH